MRTQLFSVLIAVSAALLGAGTATAHTGTAIRHCPKVVGTGIFSAVDYCDDWYQQTIAECNRDHKGDNYALQACYRNANAWYSDCISRRCSQHMGSMMGCSERRTLSSGHTR